MLLNKKTFQVFRLKNIFPIILPKFLVLKSFFGVFNLFWEFMEFFCLFLANAKYKRCFGENVLEDCYYLVIFDGLHRCKCKVIVL